MGNELSRKISNKKPTIKKSKPRRTTIPTSHHRNSSSSSIIRKRGKNDKGRRCSRTEPVKVVLKSIKNSKNMSSYYIKNLKNYYRYSALICPQRIQHYLEFYGVTQNPTSGEYLLRPTAKQLKYILDYWYQCAVGNLRHDSRCMKITNEFLRADEQVRFLFQANEMFEQEEEMKDKTWFTSRLWTFKLNNDSSTKLVTSTEIVDNWEMQQSQKSEQKSQHITTEP
ncbi:4988_t:CDS:2 [Gigaspora rosea]|nr:4988_t:CDS:2 [Gigaspora rosea]